MRPVEVTKPARVRAEMWGLRCSRAPLANLRQSRTKVSAEQRGGPIDIAADPACLICNRCQSRSRILKA